jgi:signal transduction histidine kinase
MSTKVMVVEDNRILLENIAFELEMRGYNVMQAVDGQAALELLKATTPPPDIIVSDIAMPNMDGYALLEQVRSEDDWNNIPFLFLTAFDSRSAVRISNELGADDYITKPFQPDDLVAAMENKLARIAHFRRVAADQINNARQEFLHMISHELRTPLSIIFGGSEMLAEVLEDVPEESTARMLKLVQSGVNRLNRLVNNILYLLAIDSGYLDRLIDKMAQDYDATDIVSAASESIVNEAQYQAKNLVMEIIQPEQPTYVKGVQDYLILMASELIHNAFQFSPRGGKITIEVRRAGDEVQIIVSDEGPGVPADRLDEVWTRFVQIEREYHEQQGVGLGLSITRDAARAHGGDCTIESEVGKGTRVTLHLPASG